MAKDLIERIGEVWVTDDSSRFLNGPAAGMTLAEASEKYGTELHGSSWPGRRFPLLAKYIFTSDWLSVQVHPDDAYADAPTMAAAWANARCGISSRRIPTPRSCWG